MQGRKLLFLLAQEKSSALQVCCEFRSLPRTASGAPIRASGTACPPSQGQARFARRLRRPLTGRACGAFWQRGRADGTARPVLAGSPMRSLAFSDPHIVQKGLIFSSHSSCSLLDRLEHRNVLLPPILLRRHQRSHSILAPGTDIRALLDQQLHEARKANRRDRCRGHPGAVFPTCVGMDRPGKAEADSEQFT